MELYKIGSEVKELKSAKGNMFKKMNLRDEAGVVTEGVVSFSTDSLYASLVSGAEVEGTMSESYYNGRKSYTLKGGTLGPNPFRGGGQKTEQISKAMDRKEESISSFQHNKEEGIILSASARDATLLVTSAYDLKGLNNEDIREKWLMWRKWLLRNYKQVEGLNSHGEHVPFSKVSVDEDIDVNSIPF